MVACCSDFKGALGVGLSLHLGKVYIACRLVGKDRLQIQLVGTQACAAFEDLYGLVQRTCTVYQRSPSRSGLARVVGRHDESIHVALPQAQRHGQRTVYGAYGAVQRELAEKGKVRQPRGTYLLRGDENTQRDGQVKGAALLSSVSRREVDGNAPARPLKAAVAQGGQHALLAFAHGAVGQADDGEGGQ